MKRRNIINYSERQFSKQNGNKEETLHSTFQLFVSMLADTADKDRVIVLVQCTTSAE